MKNLFRNILFFFLLFGSITLFGQAIDLNNKGAGPVKKMTLPAEINTETAAQGEILYNNYCTACHAPGSPAGPELNGITTRRSPEWIMNMILVPEKMNSEDPIAKELSGRYPAPMVNMQLSHKQARMLLEYLKTMD